MASNDLLPREVAQTILAIVRVNSLREYHPRQSADASSHSSIAHCATEASETYVTLRMRCYERCGDATARIVGVTPKQRLERACERRGRSVVVKGCVDLLRGEELDDDFIIVLGGAHGVSVFEGSDGGRDGYWPRVWAVRGLLHVRDAATPDIVRATSHSSWRVREMAAKVVARHLVDEALPAVVDLRGDLVARVRAAATRVVIALTSAV